MSIAGWLLKKAGWKYEANTDIPAKCVVVVAPHTSNWDFILGELATRSVGIKANFLMKDTWFFFPVGNIMRALGGIPVKQGKHTRVTDEVVEAFNSRESMIIGVTPEGTRSRNGIWHKGFWHIAKAAHVPVLLAYIDYSKRTVCIDKEYPISEDIETDIAGIKDYYKNYIGKHPENFITE
ncbi:MAG: 1-acyl-sn-glycerol-3-phosphate acyltransferase [Bacteroidales bacterium]|nr:1-acyl-sn-glycerol-3-phosphate acyltransferase [Candidatus Sodaliphilus aphodohippi]